jgi:hypothetical protein
MHIQGMRPSYNNVGFVSNQPTGKGTMATEKGKDGVCTYFISPCLISNEVPSVQLNSKLNSELNSTFLAWTPHSSKRHNMEFTSHSRPWFCRFVFHVLPEELFD